MTQEKFEFKPKDKVECTFFGDEVFEVHDTGHKDFPIAIINNEGNNFGRFTSDGKYLNQHTHPVLTLVERPKKKVTKTVECWANIYPDGSAVFRTTKEHADKCALVNRIACVHMTGSYEVFE
jgi:hypothetical protein